MKTYLADKIDVAVIGAGHAGIEAALAAVIDEVVPNDREALLQFVRESER